MKTLTNATPQTQQPDAQLHMAEAIIDMLHGRNQRLSSQISAERSTIRQLRCQATNRTWQIQDAQRDQQQAIYSRNVMIILMLILIGLGLIWLLLINLGGTAS
ncbi:MAG: hypothetical protein VXW65_12350 [Pseudomonadota bacterium]|nr:hypothetical protein [Pseudomonadota bacterium]